MVYLSSSSNNSLHLAVMRGDEEAVKSLLEQCVALEALNEFGNTALHLACKKKVHGIVERLLDHGASLHTTNSLGCTALHEAVTAGTEDTVSLLLKRGAHVEAVNMFGYNALYLSCVGRFHRIAEVLLNNGASVHTANKQDGRTALHAAAFQGTVDTVHMLLQRGADVCAVDQKGFTPLHDAASARTESCSVKLLLSNRADIEAENNYGDTPLATAINYGDIRAARLLISSGANVLWNNTKRGGCDTLLHVAVNECRMALPLLLDNAKLEVDTVVGGGKTALQAAAILSNGRDVVLYLIRKGAQVNYRHQGSGFTALHFAVQDGSSLTVELLLECGADLNVEDKEGRTPVGLAVELSCSEMYPALAKQLVMMKAQNLFVSERNLKALSEDDELKSLSEPYEAEIQRMSESRIGDSHVKVLDLFSKGENRLARYAANDIVEQMLEDENYEAEFPIYANVIRDKFRQGRRRRDLLMRSSEWLFTVINECYDLPQDCVEIINGCLTNANLTLQIE